MACRKVIPGMLFTIALFLTGCSYLPGKDPFNQVYPKGHIAPTPSGPPIVLPVSACESSEFNHDANIAAFVNPLEEGNPKQVSYPNRSLYRPRTLGSNKVNEAGVDD